MSDHGRSGHVFHGRLFLSKGSHVLDDRLTVYSLIISPPLIIFLGAAVDVHARIFPTKPLQVSICCFYQSFVDDISPMDVP